MSSDGSYVAASGKWGICSEGCPKEGKNITLELLLTSPSYKILFNDVNTTNNFINISEESTYIMGDAQPVSIHEFREYYLKLNHEEVSAVAHQPKDMIRECIYSAQSRQADPRCSSLIAKGGTKIFTPSYGVCYMFNFKGLRAERYPPVTFYPGEQYGLQLTVNIESA